jgi:hypothetical protein
MMRVDHPLCTENALNLVDSLMFGFVFVDYTFAFYFCFFIGL